MRKTATIRGTTAKKLNAHSDTGGKQSVSRTPDNIAGKINGSGGQNLAKNFFID
jgi:hypothetical protein